MSVENYILCSREFFKINQKPKSPEKEKFHDRLVIYRKPPIPPRVPITQKRNSYVFGKSKDNRSSQDISGSIKSFKSAGPTLCHFSKNSMARSISGEMKPKLPKLTVYVPPSSNEHVQQSSHSRPPSLTEKNIKKHLANSQNSLIDSNPHITLSVQSSVSLKSPTETKKLSNSDEKKFSRSESKANKSIYKQTLEQQYYDKIYEDELESQKLIDLIRSQLSVENTKNKSKKPSKSILAFEGDMEETTKRILNQLEDLEDLLVEFFEEKSKRPAPHIWQSKKIKKSYDYFDVHILKKLFPLPPETFDIEAKDSDIESSKSCESKRKYSF